VRAVRGTRNRDMSCQQYDSMASSGTQNMWLVSGKEP
jgi:hypothetical protein